MHYHEIENGASVKNHYRAALAGLAAVVFAGTGSVAHAEGPAPVLVNGNFENGDTGWAAWGGAIIRHVGAYGAGGSSGVAELGGHGADQDEVLQQVFVLPAYCSGRLSFQMRSDFLPSNGFRELTVHVSDFSGQNHQLRYYTNKDKSPTYVAEEASLPESMRRPTAQTVTLSFVVNDWDDNTEPFLIDDVQVHCAVVIRPRK
ncbi:hypothetical protein V1460_12750 [Streptomyces sp. SCSIO 30461]|uniref:hypothetical protein n=1 Tax=Streptomyces sp. SCSIO 30461 TaxID=3118085 RepID=UPI0030D093F0